MIDLFISFNSANMRSIELENIAFDGDCCSPTTANFTVITTPKNLVRINFVFFVDIIGPTSLIHQSHSSGAIMNILGHLDEFECFKRRKIGEFLLRQLRIMIMRSTDPDNDIIDGFSSSFTLMFPF